MKRNQKKYTKKNYKGGVVDSNMAKVSLAALKKRLEDIELNLDTIKTKMGEVNPVEGPSRENNTGFGEAGYPVAPIGQSNPMKKDDFVRNPSTSEKLDNASTPDIPDFVSNSSTSEKLDNASTPIKPTQYAEVDSLNEEIKLLQKNPNKFNREKLKTKIGLKNALLAKFQKRVDYLENQSTTRTLSQEEIDELGNLKSNLTPNQPLGGGRKSRRYRKSRKGKRTRKYKK
jgi:hypothetical protein